MKQGSNGCSVNCSGPQSNVSAVCPESEGSGVLENIFSSQHTMVLSCLKLPVRVRWIFISNNTRQTNTVVSTNSTLLV